VGLDFGRRGRLLDHTLEVCRTLWTEPRADYDGDELRFTGIHQMPKPTQAGGVPIWVSGRVQPKVVERIVRFGSGWIPWGDDAADPIAGAGRMRAALTAAGHDPTALGIVGRLPIDGRHGLGIEGAMADVPTQVAAGITDFRAGVRLAADPAEARARVREVVTAFRAATGRPPHTTGGDRG
jgi:alkanesulfonate monooxygenase SsuD/methylene tetrahydromethanopterin reductase-like flavin-dependent oxidoreductase (luciferase family)